MALATLGAEAPQKPTPSPVPGSSSIRCAPRMSGMLWGYGSILGLMLVLGCGTAAVGALAGGYARADLLAETEWLAQQLEAPGIRIVDMRTAEAYRKSHIPGAVHVEWKALKDPENEVHVIPPERFAELMSQLGVSNETTVVGYDDQGGMGPARLWWVLDYYGHTQVKVLNGGWNKWMQERHPVSNDEPTLQPSAFSAWEDPSKICLVDELLTEMKRPNVVIIDARSSAEYTGFDVQAKRGGHIPRAVNIDWTRNVTNDALKVFRPAAELLKMYEAVGVTKDKEVIAHCQTGVRAAHTLFTLTLLGYTKVRNYDASWQEWGNRLDLPIAR